MKDHRSEGARPSMHSCDQVSSTLENTAEHIFPHIMDGAPPVYMCVCVVFCVSPGFGIQLVGFFKILSFSPFPWSGKWHMLYLLYMYVQWNIDKWIRRLIGLKVWEAKPFFDFLTNRVKWLSSQSDLLISIPLYRYIYVGIIYLVQ